MSCDCKPGRVMRLAACLLLVMGGLVAAWWPVRPAEAQPPLAAGAQPRLEDPFPRGVPAPAQVPQRTNFRTRTFFLAPVATSWRVSSRRI